MPQRKTYASHAQRQAAYRRRCQEARRIQLQEKGLPELPAISNFPGTARWKQAIASAVKLLSLVEEEMQSYYDDRSEAWLESERADEFQERIEAIAEARQFVENTCAD
jgi:hypothetical protein